MQDNLYFEVVAEKWVKNARDFNMSTHQVSIMFEKALNCKFNDIQKLRITLSEDGEYLFSPPVEMFPFVFIDKKFDFNSYWAANEAERKKIVVETLYEGIKDMCEKMKLDLAPFHQAYLVVCETLN